MLGLFEFCFFLLYWVFIATCGLSQVVARSGYSLVVVREFLTAVTSLTWEALGCMGFSNCGSRALEHKLSIWDTMGSITLQHVGASWTRDRTHVSCVGR